VAKVERNAVTTVGAIRLQSYSREEVIPRRGEIDTHEPKKAAAVVRDTNAHRSIASKTVRTNAGFSIRWWYLHETQHIEMFGKAHSKVHVLRRASFDDPAEKSACVLDLLFDEALLVE
jgi:hypothetical protein